MLITIKIILLIMIFFSFFGVIGEKKDYRLREILSQVCMVSILALVAVVTLT